MRKLTQSHYLHLVILLLFVLLATDRIAVWATGSEFLGDDIFRFFLIIFLVLSSVALLRPVMRRLVWRVRNRLLVTYFLVGVLPILLILTMILVGMSALLGTMVSYLVQSELDRRFTQLERSARQFAVPGAEQTLPAIGDDPAARAIVRSSDDRRISSDGPISDMPSWSRPGFRGLVHTNEGLYFAAVHVQTMADAGSAQVFAYRPFDDEILAELISGFGIASLAKEQGDDIEMVFDSTTAVAAAKPGGFGLGARGVVPLAVRSLETGGGNPHWISLYCQPTVVLNRLFGGLGPLAAAALMSLLILGAALLSVEFIALISSANLTRSLTSTIHNLYAGTKKIESGDFSHRIPIQSNDQLSELAKSFNVMTERIERLIVEVKEKEKLESELEIARQVQAQLFPKGVPQLRTLELAGYCKPARVVSGDYYDFITLDSDLTALVMGDISGKGISAALVMAGLQSSLRAQLATATNGAISTAALVARLNRQIYDNTPPEKYATFYCGIYNENTGNLLYTNAGHLPPILLRRRTAIRLEPNGTVVGMLPDFPYAESTIALESGDLLVAFTDGITESENEQGEQFGEERLTDLLIENCERPLDDITRIVTERLEAWAYDKDNQDDTTILLVRRL